MLLSTAEDLASFVAELRKESDRGLALVGSALIDEKLKETLRAFFVAGESAGKLLDLGNAALGSLSTRIDACHALGLIDEYERTEIGLIRKIRNEFAHAIHGLSFRGSKVSGLCASLTSALPEGADFPLSDPRFRYTNAVVCITLRLYHRPDWVKLERRVAKQWVEADLTRWRSFADEPPPETAPILAIGKSVSKDATGKP